MTYKATLLTTLLLLFTLHLSAGWFTDGNYEYIYEGISDKVTIKNHFDDTATEVTIPHYVTYRGKTYTVNKIGERAFAKHVNLTEIVIPNWIEGIGAEAFMGCSGITTISIPSSVKTIGDYTFSGCTKLADISLPTTLNMIGCGAFNNTAWLTAQTGTEVYIGDYLVKYTSGGTLTPRTGTLGIVGGNIRATSVDFSQCKETFRFIGSQAFYRNHSLTNIALPENLTHIGSSAFASCINMESVTAGNKLIDIGNNAFTDTKFVRNANGLVYVGNAVVAYSGSSNADISVANGITLIADAAFSSKKINSLTLPESVKSLGRMAFYNSSIGTLTMPAQIDNYHLGYDYCWWCAPDDDLTYGLVEDVSYRYFDEDDPSGSMSIEQISYYDSSAPFTYSQIGKFELTGTGNLIVDNGILYNSDKTILLKSSNEMPADATIAPTVKYIGFSAFYKQTMTNREMLPEGVEVIGASAWEDGKLSSIDIPATVRYIGQEAFYCSMFTYLYYANKWPDYYGYLKQYYHKVIDNIYFHGTYPPIMGKLLTATDASDPTHIYCRYLCYKDTDPKHISSEAIDEMKLLKTVSWNADNIPVKDWDAPDMKDLYSMFLYYALGNETSSYNDYMNTYPNYGMITNAPDRYYNQVIVSNAGYATTYLPYVSQVPDGLKAYVGGEITEEEDKSIMTLPEVTDGILAANEGAVIKGNPGTYTFEEREATPTITSTTNKLQGQECHDISKPNGNIYTLTTKYKTTEYPVAFAPYIGTTMRAYAAWWENPEPIGPRPVMFRFGKKPTATGIRNIETEGKASTFYDLMGHRIQNVPTKKGIYIVNGRKVVKK